MVVVVEEMFGKAFVVEEDGVNTFVVVVEGVVEMADGFDGVVVVVVVEGVIVVVDGLDVFVVMIVVVEGVVEVVDGFNVVVVEVVVIEGLVGMVEVDDSCVLPGVAVVCCVEEGNNEFSLFVDESFVVDFICIDVSGDIVVLVAIGVLEYVNKSSSSTIPDPDPSNTPYLSH